MSSIVQGLEGENIPIGCTRGPLALLCVVKTGFVAGETQVTQPD